MSLKPEYFCLSCKKRQDKDKSTLKTCVRCGVAQYCDRNCQKEDFKTHKGFCSVIQKNVEFKSVMAKAMEEIHIPDFLKGSMMEQTPELVQYFSLGQLFFDFAEHHQSYLGFEKAAEQFEKLRHKKTNGTYYKYGFLIFIYCNLGLMEKAQEILSEWEQEIDECYKNQPSWSILPPYNPPILIAARLALKLDSLNKIRNPETSIETLQETLFEYPLGSIQQKLAKTQLAIEEIKFKITQEIAQLTQDCNELFRQMSDYPIACEADRRIAFVFYHLICPANRLEMDGGCSFQKSEYQLTAKINLKPDESEDSSVLLKITFGYLKRLPGLQKALDAYNNSDKYVDWEIAVRKGYNEDESDEESESGEDSDEEWIDVDE